MNKFIHYFENLKMNWMKLEVPADKTLDMKKSVVRARVDIAREEQDKKQQLEKLKKQIEDLGVKTVFGGLETDLEPFKGNKKLEKFLSIYTHPIDKKLYKIPTGSDPVKVFKADLLNTLKE